MTVERIKEIVSKNVFIKILLPIFLIAVVVLYFKVFFTTGVYYDNTFLKKEAVSSDRHYIGKNRYGGIHITIKGMINKHPEAEVIYRLPHNINKRYTVTFKDAGNWNQGIENIKDEYGNIVFEGDYRKDSYFLFDKNGQPLVGDAVRIMVNGEASYNENYEFSLKDVADFAYSAEDTIRGKYEYLIPAVILFVITFVEIRYPMFFFLLEHMWDVKDPEPSDFYISMQRISWVAYPTIGIFLMIAAIL